MRFRWSSLASHSTTNLRQSPPDVLFRKLRRLAILSSLALDLNTRDAKLVLNIVPVELHLTISIVNDMSDEILGMILVAMLLFGWRIIANIQCARDGIDELCRCISMGLSVPGRVKEEDFVLKGC